MENQNRALEDQTNTSRTSSPVPKFLTSRRFFNTLSVSGLPISGRTEQHRTAEFARRILVTSFLMRDCDLQFGEFPCIDTIALVPHFQQGILPRITDQNASDVGLEQGGWLAREDQIVITPEKRSFRIRLKQEHAKATGAS